MSALDLLLLSSLLALAAPLLVWRSRQLGLLMPLLYALQLSILFVACPPGSPPDQLTASWQPQVMGQTLSWQLDGLGWLFALITLGAALLGSWYAGGEWIRRFRDNGGSPRLLHFALAFNVTAMLLFLASGDLLSLFIGWELVSWASFLLMALGGAMARRAAMHYINYAMFGAMCLFGAVAFLSNTAGSLQYDQLIAAISHLSTTQLWVLVLLFTSAFGIKMGLLPFHLWQAAAYAETPAPGAAFLGAISSRMGLYGLVLVLVKLIGITRLTELSIPFTFLDLRQLLAWVAALTIIIPTFTAMRQNDARRLLAWHGIGQGGYMLLGIVMADPLGASGGLLHVFNHATYQAALFLAVHAVVHRTGTADLNRLGGLVTRMPLSFLTLLIGIIGLAGLPPMNGFVSKWLIYRSLLENGMPLLFVASVIGTLGTILSVYKLIHNIFLGQLRVEHEQVSEAPWSMLWPMLILSALIFVTGLLPGIPLAWVATALAAVGLSAAPYSPGGVILDNGSLDMLWVVGVLFAGFGIAAVLFHASGRSRRVHQLDNYAGGHFLTADTRYQYSDNFYAGLMHRIAPWYRGSFEWLERSLVSLLDLLSLAMQGIYRQARGEYYLLGLGVCLLAWVVI